MLKNKELDFLHVADVVHPGGSLQSQLNWAYERTNNIDRPWHEHADVTVWVEKRFCRSTHIGDIIQTNDGGFYLVKSTGFELLDVDL